MSDYFIIPRMGQLADAVRNRAAQSEMRKGWRRKRMATMLQLVGIPQGARIVDLGGTHEIWQGFEHGFHITLVNLPEASGPGVRHPAFSYVYQDACDLTDVFPDLSFDFAFSNSTIEHVGDEARQEQFAREVRRLANSYWVQTPSDKFPLEAHTYVPFYWKLPPSVRGWMMRRWKCRVPAWSEMVEGTRVLTRQRMQDLFPNGRCYVERLYGLEKSCAYYRPCQG
jgi:hypothetical protein